MCSHSYSILSLITYILHSRLLYYAVMLSLLSFNIIFLSQCSFRVYVCSVSSTTLRFLYSYCSLLPLQCKCCQLEDPSSLVTTLPDLCVAYKLHLECGRHINLYDWLQAFISVVGQEEEEEEQESSKMVDEKLQYPLTSLSFIFKALFVLVFLAGSL